MPQITRASLATRIETEITAAQALTPLVPMTMAELSRAIANAICDEFKIAQPNVAVIGSVGTIDISSSG